jgi:hypothetical protein
VPRPRRGRSRARGRRERLRSGGRARGATGELVPRPRAPL